MAPRGLRSALWAVLVLSFLTLSHGYTSTTVVQVAPITSTSSSLPSTSSTASSSSSGYLSSTVIIVAPISVSNTTPSSSTATSSTFSSSSATTDVASSTSSSTSSVSPASATTSSASPTSPISSVSSTLTTTSSAPSTSSSISAVSSTSATTDPASSTSSSISSVSSTSTATSPTPSTFSSISSVSSTSATINSASSTSSSTSAVSSTSATASSVSSTSSSIYSASSTLTTTSSASPTSTALTVKQYTYYGCQTEATNMRALASKMTAYDTMTLESCASDCVGYTYFGTEFSRECYCGNSFNVGSVPAPSTDCYMLCDGNSLETCGGPMRLSVFQLSALAATVTSGSALSTPSVGVYTYYGCQTEGTNMRALAEKSFAADYMTLEACETFCAGYTYFGTEYARECYCGNSFSAGSVAAPPADCSFLCLGNLNEVCGASRRLSVYKLTGPTPPPPIPPAIIATGWVYQGCWVDGANGRILTFQENDNHELTVEGCVATCTALGYSIAGLEWSIQCFCGNSIVNGGVLAESQLDCNFPCSGNPNETCGAGLRLSIYSQGSVSIPGAVRN